jgi:Fe-S-cluster-containing dehydrogenase component
VGAAGLTTIPEERGMDQVPDRVLIVDADKCTGCCVCELACSMAKHGEYNPSRSYIKVMKNSEMSVDIVALDIRCDFCDKCVEMCLARAIGFVDRREAAVIRKQNRIGKFPAPLFSGGIR